MSFTISRTFFSLLLLISCHAATAQHKVTVKGQMDGVAAGMLYMYEETATQKILHDSVALIPGKPFTLSVEMILHPGFLYLHANGKEVERPIALYVNSENISFTMTRSEGKVSFESDEQNKALFTARQFFPGRTGTMGEKEWKTLTGKINKKKARLLYDYLQFEKRLISVRANGKLSMKQLKEMVDELNSNTTLLASDASEQVFSELVHSFYYDSLSAEAKAMWFEKSFYEMMAHDPAYKNEVRAKVGKLYSDFMTRKEHFQALANYLLTYGANPGSPGPGSNFPKLLPGVKIKSLKGITGKGDTIDIHDIKTPYRLILIWAPDCGHCLQAIPILNSMYRKVAGKGITFISLSTMQASPIVLDEFDWKTSYSILNGWRNEFLMKYGISYTPLMILLNKKEQIVEVQTEPYKMEETLIKLLQK